MVVTIRLAVLEVRKRIQMGKGACLKPHSEEVTVRIWVHICLFPMLRLGCVPEVHRSVQSWRWNLEMEGADPSLIMA